jgi:hypothetical protein
MLSVLYVPDNAQIYVVDDGTYYAVNKIHAFYIAAW